MYWYVLSICRDESVSYLFGVVAVGELHPDVAEQDNSDARWVG